MKNFNHFYDLACERKGGREIIESMLSPIMSIEELSEKPDAYFLEWMTRCIFNAGFYWAVITKKWPGFQEAFLGFDIDMLLSQDEDFWIALGNDTKIVRHKTKISAIRVNLNFIQDIRMEYGSFGSWLAQWPSSDQAGLLWFLKKRGSRLGGMTAQYFLRFVGKDSFITSRDMVLALKHAGLDIAHNPSSKRDFIAIQEILNTWHKKSGIGYADMSKILAFSAGENHSVQVISRETSKWEDNKEKNI